MLTFQPSFASLMATASLPTDPAYPLSDAPPDAPASPSASRPEHILAQLAPTTAPGTQQRQQGATDASADRDTTGKHAAFYLPNPAPCQRDSEYSAEYRHTLGSHNASGVKDASASTPNACENGPVSVNVFQGTSVYTDDYTQKSAEAAQSIPHGEVCSAPTSCPCMKP
jgi:hypothetical protein